MIHFRFRLWRNGGENTSGFFLFCLFVCFKRLQSCSRVFIIIISGNSVIHSVVWVVHALICQNRWSVSDVEQLRFNLILNIMFFSFFSVPTILDVLRSCDLCYECKIIWSVPSLVLLSSNTVVPHNALFEQLLSLGIRRCVVLLVKGWCLTLDFIFCLLSTHMFLDYSHKNSILLSLGKYLGVKHNCN